MLEIGEIKRAFLEMGLVVQRIGTSSPVEFKVILPQPDLAENLQVAVRWDDETSIWWATSSQNYEIARSDDLSHIINSILEYFAPALEHIRLADKIQLIRWLGRSKGVASTDLLMSMLADKNIKHAERQQIVEALSSIGGDRVYEALLHIVETDQTLVRDVAMARLPSVGGDKAIAPLVSILIDPNELDDIRVSAFSLLLDLGRVGTEALLSLNDYNDPFVSRIIDMWSSHTDS